MRYEPVKIHTLFQVVTDLNTGKISRTNDYYQVRSASLGDCGHKHTTEGAAQPCLSKMSTEFTKRRSEASKNAWKRRREQNA